MTRFLGWYLPRRRVFWFVAAGWSSFLVVLALGWNLVPRLDPIPLATDRLLLAAQLAALPAVVVMAVLQTLWRMGDTVEAESDPLSGKESQRFKINQRVMSNTVEQTLIFVPMMIALAVRMRPEHVWALPLLVGIWCVGRLMFWAGYHVEPAARAFGMDWTSGSALVTAFWLLSTLL